MPALPAPRSPAGFTLIELLVGLVLAGLLAGVIFGLLQGQSRFARLQSARTEVQGSTRAVLELISSDVRSAGEGGMEVAGAYRLVLRVPRVWGAVCAVNPLTTPQTVDVAVPAAIGASFWISATTLQQPLLAADTADRGPPPKWIEPRPVSAITPGGDAGSSTCEGTSLPAGVEARRLTADAADLAPGDPVFLFDRVTYAPRNPADPGGVWIARKVGDADFQMVAGPVAGSPADPTGFRFRYFAIDGTPIPIPSSGELDQAARRQIARVETIVHLVGRGLAGPSRPSERDSVSVFLRNPA